MMFKDWPRGAALWWRRIPTATSGRAVRESDRMLLGSAHAVPTHEDVHKMCSHVPSGTAGTSRRRSSYTPGTPSRRARVSADAAVVVAAAAASACGGPAAAASLGRKVARTPPRRPGSQKCWRRIPTEHVNVLSEKVILIGSSHADMKHCDCAKGEFWLKVPHLYKYRQYIWIRAWIHIHMIQARYSQPAAFVDFCHCKIENKSTKPKNTFSLVNNSFKHHV